MAGRIWNIILSLSIEATNLQEMIEKFYKCERQYHSRVLADKIYNKRQNIRYCKERRIGLSDPALGSPRKDTFWDKAQDYRDECDRGEVERKFCLGKRKCGIWLVTAKLEETATHVIAWPFCCWICVRFSAPFWASWICCLIFFDCAKMWGLFSKQ